MENETNYLDVWLRFDTDDEPDAEANTRMTDTGYAVDWSLEAVGQITTVEFDTLAEAYDWLEKEGFSDYTA